ncbi:hypothetical protein DFH08DRAFT_1011661 [Mycena albidolilacea]|uniref:Uncharacterized protein n=1 Tax=Mycena albidolilacea TaxID=1033008 RepID=A0AAD6ZWJ5_9AGAR|nr:hypothetical protein DFH08DRAFT_1011661 [Mycena albidolilacea]
MLCTPSTSWNPAFRGTAQDGAAWQIQSNPRRDGETVPNNNRWPLLSTRENSEVRPGRIQNAAGTMSISSWMAPIPIPSDELRAILTRSLLTLSALSDSYTQGATRCTLGATAAPYTLQAMTHRLLQTLPATASPSSTTHPDAQHSPFLLIISDAAALRPSRRAPPRPRDAFVCPCVAPPSLADVTHLTGTTTTLTTSLPLMTSLPPLPVLLTFTPRIRPASRSPAAPPAPPPAIAALPRVFGPHPALQQRRLRPHAPSTCHRRRYPLPPANALLPAAALLSSCLSMPTYPQTSNPSALFHPTRLYPILLLWPSLSPRLRARAAPSLPSNVIYFHPIPILVPCPDAPPHSDARQYSSTRRHARLRAASPTYSSHHSVRYSQSCHAWTSTAAHTNVDAVSNPCSRPERPTR